MWRRVFLFALACLLLRSVTSDGAQSDQPKPAAGSIKIKLDVEIDGVLEVKGREFSVLVSRAELAAPFVPGQEAEQRWTLDFAAARDLLPLARELAGKTVVVHGKCVLQGISTVPAPKSGPAHFVQPNVGPSIYAVLNLQKQLTVQRLTLAQPPEQGAGKPPAAGPPAKEAKLPALKKRAELPAAAAKKLAAGKVVNKKQAENAAVTFKFKHGSGILAEESWHALGLYVDNNGDPVWVVEFVPFVTVFKEGTDPYHVRINAVTGEAWRQMASPKLFELRD